MLKYFAKVAILLLILTLNACSATKHVLKDDESLLVSNSIDLQYKGENIDDKASIKENLAKQVVYNQQPNKKFLNFFRLKLGIYALSYKRKQKDNYEEKLARKKEKKQNKLDKKSEKYKAKGKTYKIVDKQLSVDNISDFSGEPPVLFDSTTISTSVNRMKNYLFYHGFFHNDVSYNYQTKKKKTTVTYHVKPNDAFKIRNVYRQTEDSTLKDLILIGEKDAFIKPGDVFDIENVNLERERITNIILNEGYYTFREDFIILKLDSTIGNNMIDCYIVVKNEVDASIHTKYNYLEVNYNINYNNKIFSYQVKNTDFLKDTICDVYYKVLKNTVLPRILAQKLRIKPGDLYSEKSEVATRNNLYGLGVFKFINIKHDPFSFSPEEMGLITTIDCEPAKRNTFGSQLEVNTNATSTLGFNLVGTYTNRNVFNTAAKLYVNASTGIDFQLKQRTDNGIKLSPINAINLNLETKISLARIFPKIKKVQCAADKKYNEKTNIGFNYNYQKRIQLYSIHTFNLNYGYEWYNDKYRHLFTPLGLTYVRPTSISDSFQNRLDSNIILQRSFDQQFILGQDYTFLYTNQQINVGKYKNHFFFRGNINLAGNILMAFSSLTNKDKNKPYKLSKIPFAQYIRLEAEPKYFFNFKRGQALGLRFFGGIGIPYGNSYYDNSRILPYVKQFYAGGPNSLRAWQFRQIGPGGYNFHNTNVSQLDQTGDIRLELNAEYRFNIYKYFKAALFSDAGNIWLIKKDENRPNAEFNVKRFGKELAWDAGIGMRLDLSFFIIRFDVGVPLHDPSFDKGHRWIGQIIKDRKDYIETQRELEPSLSKKYIRKNDLGNLLGFNIAIGYPF